MAKCQSCSPVFESAIPKISAWFLFTLPVGIGLKQVLDINLSKSASYHMFNVPAAPAPRATAIKDTKALIKLACIGAINNPTTQVKITNDITRGFINWKKLFKELIELKSFILKCCNLDSW